MPQAPCDLFVHGDGSCGQLGLGEDVAEKLRPFPLQINGMKVLKACKHLCTRENHDSQPHYGGPWRVVLHGVIGHAWGPASAGSRRV